MAHAFPTRRSSDLEYPLAIRSSARRSRLDAYFARWRVTVLLLLHKVQASRRRSKPRVPPSARVTTLACAGTDRLSRSVTQRSEEHTSELQSLMRISYAVFCLTKKKILHIYL